MRTKSAKTAHKIADYTYFQNFLLIEYYEICNIDYLPELVSTYLGTLGSYHGTEYGTPGTTQGLL